MSEVIPETANAAERIRIVLVEPSHPGNIGGAARAMKVMGLSRLVLVRPQRYPDPQAEWRAAGAVDVLDDARVVEHLEEAVGDCQLVIGTSTRSRRIPWPLVDARGAAERIFDEATGQQVAILFGREASGLTNDELQACQVHLSIPANPEYPSLNLAMAVQVVCYELYQHLRGEDGRQPPAWDREAATGAQLEALLTHWEQVLEGLDFLDPDNPGQVMTRFRRLLLRVGLDETEVQMLRGFLNHIQRQEADR